MNLEVCWADDPEETFLVSVLVWESRTAFEFDYGVPIPFNPDGSLVRLPKHWQWVG